MKHAIFFILSSRAEGFSNVIIESLACGTPVIATNCKTGPSEIIENGKNGLLVPVENEVALRKTMEKLYNDKNLYLYLKDNAFNSIEEYDIEKIVEDWIKVFWDIDHA